MLNFFNGADHCSAGDVVAGDSVGISGSGVFTGGKNVGTGKAIEVQTASLAGTDAAKPVDDNVVDAEVKEVKKP